MSTMSQDKIEEVKKILKDNTHTHYEEFGNSGKIPFADLDIDKATFQICHLFEPKPDENRLLTLEKIDTITFEWEDAYQEHKAVKPLKQVICLEQDAKTASIKDAECQQRVEKLLSLMNMRDVGGVEPEWALSNKDYQALKKQEKAK